jgi:hypothetical protein
MHLTQAFRLVGTWRYKRTPLAQRNTDAAVGRLCNHQAVSGVVWGLSPWLFFPVGNMQLTALMMLLLLALSSIGVVALSAYRRAMISFTLPIYVGLASALFWQLGCSKTAFSATHCGRVTKTKNSPKTSPSKYTW